VLLFFLPACVDLLAKPGDAGDTGAAVATASLYVNSGSTLYTWDTDVLDTVLVGGFWSVTDDAPIAEMLDIAIDPDGHLYGAEDRSLYRIDAVDATCTLVTTLPTTGTGLTFLPDGRLVVGGESLQTVDLDTGATTEIIPAGVYATSGDLVGIPQGTVQWTVTGTTSDQWVSVDPDTGAATLLGDVGASTLWGVAYADYTLYAFGSDGNVWTVDPVTGEGTLVASSIVSFYGATTNPVEW
jgi:hypothetical protein